jgi:hypothetical protein
MDGVAQDRCTAWSQSEHRRSGIYQRRTVHYCIFFSIQGLSNKKKNLSIFKANKTELAFWAQPIALTQHNPCDIRRELQTTGVIYEFLMKKGGMLINQNNAIIIENMHHDTIVRLQQALRRYYCYEDRYIIAT